MPYKDTSLRDLASKLDDLVGSYFRMRYPDNVACPYIPHDIYKESQAAQAQQISRDIVQKARDFIKSR